MRKKYVPILIIFMLASGLVFTSTAAYSYWQEVNNLSNVEIIFDEPNAELQVAKTSDDFTGMLVPEGYAYVQGEVDEVVFEYDVSISETLIQSMNLVVEAIDVSIGGLSEYEHLVDIQIGSGNRYVVDEIFNDTVHVVIVVKLLEPIDAAEAADRGLPNELVNVADAEAAYNAIKGETISFTIRFTVVPKN